MKHDQRQQVLTYSLHSITKNVFGDACEIETSGENRGNKIEYWRINQFEFRRIQLYFFVSFVHIRFQQKTCDYTQFIHSCTLSGPRPKVKYAHKIRIYCPIQC
jgi:hypothetical protein